MRDRPTLNAHAAAAMRSIQENGLQIDPQSFSVWYEYHNGNHELRRLIDIIRSNRATVTAEAVAKMYDRFIANPRDHHELRATAERMQETLHQLLDLVRQASDGASRSGAAVRDATGRFAARECSISALIECVLSEARDIVARAARFEGELTRNGEMIRTIQRTLADARTAAITDPLTGLANRRHLDETLQALAGAAMNHGRALSLLLLDIDHFKRVNDQFGHPVGDQVLQLAAATIRAALREGALAARYGGEEFAVLLPDTDVNQAAVVGERIRTTFARREVVLRGSAQVIGRLTVSVGAAGYEAGEPLADWVRRADVALYEAKAGGRNRLVKAAHPAPVG